MTRTHYQETALMRTQLSTLALMAALVAVASCRYHPRPVRNMGTTTGMATAMAMVAMVTGVTTHMDTGRTVPTTETSGLKWVRSTSAMKLKST